MRETLVGAIVAAVAVAALPAPAVDAADPCDPLTQSLGGTVKGEDGRYLRVMLGLEYWDAQGNYVDCSPNTGYSYVYHVNTHLDGAGTTDPTGNSYDYTVPVPEGVATIAVEAYPRSSFGTDLSRYGRAMRRSLRPGDRSADVVMPLNCGISEGGATGSNGSIQGRIMVNGEMGPVARASAFSTSADTEALPLGFGLDTAIPNGEYSIDHLASGQSYVVFVRIDDTSPTWEFKPVRVEPCSATTFDLIFGKFQDVRFEQAFFDEIYWMLRSGLSKGWADDTFRPAREVSRQAMAAWIYRLDGSPPGPFPDPGFSDVDPAHPFYGEIAWMAQAGHAAGFPDGSFRPLRCITRQSVAAFLYRHAGSPPGPFPDPGFEDLALEDPLAQPIAWMVDAGIATGYADGTYRPRECVSRQHSAAFLYRAFAV